MAKLNNWLTEKYVAYKVRDQEEEGQGLAEYGLILALVAVLCVVALGTLQGKISDTLTAVGNAM